LRVRCLSYRPGELWICTDDVMGPFALGRSTDLGVTVDPLWTFRDSVNDVGCPACSQVGEECPAYWPDAEFDLAPPTAGDALPPDLDAGDGPCGDVDAGVGPMDGGVAPTPASCACGVASRSDRGAIVLAMFLALALVRRRMD